MAQTTRIAAILACYNRKALTIAALEALMAQQTEHNCAISVYLLDDGSSDGTGDAVRAAFPDAHVLEGDGSFFWNGGMRRAYSTAMETGFDFYLWLNDDTHLYPSALKNLLQTYDTLPEASAGHILVGAVQDPHKQTLTYGGLKRSSRWHPLKFDLLHPAEKPQECEVMHGNCVLIPRAVAEKVGNLDPHYSHAIGDIDYALRARRAGARIWMAPGFVGTCSTNSESGTWLDPQMSLTKRWKAMQGPKGLPFTEWMYFAKAHAGRMWPFFGLLPYVRLVTSAIRSVGSSKSLHPVT